MNPVATLQAPFLEFPEGRSLPKNPRLFHSAILSSEHNSSFLSNSILQNYALIKPPRLHWLYHQLLLMHFDKEVVKRVLRQHSRMLDYNYTREELLNRAIDYCIAQNDNPILQDDQGLAPLFIQIEQEEEKDGSRRAYSGSILSILSSDTIFRPIRLPVRLNPLEEEIDSKNCRICLTEPENLHTIEICMHKFCYDCLYSYIKSKIELYDPKSIKCPSDGCGNPLSELFISEILQNDQQLFEKYQKFKAQLEILDHPDRKWCIKPDCPYYVEHNPADKSEKVICICGQIMCFSCGNVWHEDLTCLEAVDNDYKQYEASVMVKQCPRCLAKIEKNEGCNHMTCSRCKHEFCWICKAECINGYCVNKCPKFPENENRRRNRHFRIQNDFFLRMNDVHSVSVNVLMFIVNFLFFLILSNALVLMTCWIAFLAWVNFTFIAHNSLLISCFESSNNMNLSPRAKIIHYLIFPFKFLMFLIGAILIMIFQILKLPVLVFANIAKYIYFFEVDQSALSLILYERRREFYEENLNVIPRIGYSKVIILLLALFYVEALVWGYYEIIIKLMME